MKTLLHAFAMCQSMFCAIPCPWKVWDEEARDKMLLFLPVVGLEIGLLWAGLGWLCGLLELPRPVTALALCVWPYAATGFIHLDGFMDVTDAVKSWRDAARRREILKDPHAGSFAVIGVVLLILSQFAMFASAENADLRILIFIPAVSRCCSALAVKGLPPMSTSQYADQKKPRGHLLILAAQLVICLTAGFMLCGREGATLLGCIAGHILAVRRAYRSLEGMNGDISGYALSIGELCAVALRALL